MEDTDTESLYWIHMLTDEPFYKILEVCLDTNLKWRL